jgi:hypothetical protein
VSTSEKPLHIDIPVRLTDLRIAFSIADLAFEGDLQTAMPVVGFLGGSSLAERRPLLVAFRQALTEAG